MLSPVSPRPLNVLAYSAILSAAYAYLLFLSGPSPMDKQVAWSLWVISMPIALAVLNWHEWTRPMRLPTLAEIPVPRAIDALDLVFYLMWVGMAFSLIAYLPKDGFGPAEIASNKPLFMFMWGAALVGPVRQLVRQSNGDANNIDPAGTFSDSEARRASLEMSDQQRGKQLFLRVAGLIVIHNLSYVVFALLVGPGNQGWFSSIALPAGFAVCVAMMWRGNNVLRWTIAGACILFGALHLYACFGKVRDDVISGALPQSDPVMSIVFEGLPGALYLVAAWLFLRSRAMLAFFDAQGRSAHADKGRTEPGVGADSR